MLCLLLRFLLVLPLFFFSPHHVSKINLISSNPSSSSSLKKSNGISSGPGTLCLFSLRIALFSSFIVGGSVLNSNSSLMIFSLLIFLWLFCFGFPQWSVLRYVAAVFAISSIGTYSLFSLFLQMVLVCNRFSSTLCPCVCLFRLSVPLPCPIVLSSCLSSFVYGFSE